MRVPAAPRRTPTRARRRRPAWSARASPAANGMGVLWARHLGHVRSLRVVAAHLLPPMTDVHMERAAAPRPPSRSKQHCVISFFFFGEIQLGDPHA